MKFRDYDQNQTRFVTFDYRKTLGEDSFPVLLNDIVDYLDTTSIEEKYPEIGNPGYHPKAMIKILYWGYFKGYYGGRPLHNNYKTDLALRYFSADDFPDHRTINIFRVKFIDEIADLFAQVVLLCYEVGLIGFENLSIDSHKIKANANLFQNKNLKAIEKEKKKIAKEFKELLKQGMSFWNNNDKIKKKKGKLEHRKKKLEKAAAILRKVGGEEEEEKRYNLTDPDSRIMTDKRNVKNPSYSVHLSVDDKHDVTTGVNVTNDPSDNKYLISMKEKSKENTGKTHKHTLADCGYADKEVYRKIDGAEDTEYYVAQSKNPVIIEIFPMVAVLGRSLGVVVFTTIIDCVEWAGKPVYFIHITIHHPVRSGIPEITGKLDSAVLCS